MSRRPIVGLDAYVERFRRRVVQDALAEATNTYWNRRADAFDRARPRPGDFTGRATAAELAERDARLSAVAQACQHRAAVSMLQCLDDDERRLLQEAA